MKKIEGRLRDMHVKQRERQSYFANNAAKFDSKKVDEGQGWSYPSHDTSVEESTAGGRRRNKKKTPALTLLLSYVTLAGASDLCQKV